MQCILSGGTVVKNLPVKAGHVGLILGSGRSPRESERSESHSVMSNSLWLNGLYSPWNSPGQNTGVGSLSLHQGIFPTQESNPGLPHCRCIPHQWSQSKPKNIGVDVVMYGCESWTVKKAECRRIDAFEL